MVRVTTAAEAAKIDADAVAAGTASWALMLAAGHAAAAVILQRFGPELGDGAIVFAGSGNNGGDGWLVAAELAGAGVRVAVVASDDPKTEDARRAKSLYHEAARTPSAPDGEAPIAARVVIDALLGTGSAGAPRDAVADAIGSIEALRTSGATIIALDMPSGVDATSGEAAGVCVRADVTVTFGTVKRGLLRNREAAGAIICVDIGLGAAPANSGALELLDGRHALATVPEISATAHKGARRRLLVLGGAAGMAGAAVLAARGALRSGVGMVKLCVEQASVAPVQAAEPAVLTAAWPADADVLKEYLQWAHCVLLGPGLGLTRASRELAMRVLSDWRGPVVVDADALTAFEGKADQLGELLQGRPAIITPHAVEAHRLAGVPAADIDVDRFDAAARLALRVNAVVLLKGVPTVVSDGLRTIVVAAGTPVLATGGSGDVLGGIVATLLAQSGDPVASAATGAWIHGRAAELAGAGRVRGVALDDVVRALRDAWVPPSAPVAPVLLELASVRGDR
ncbi:MAG: NAD(P)H-hydrate dehydratase [Gemmatimonadetes bacterium]|nr:NAD(P)H-hydrate dehydratase [Gemmatimonadota bacterium]